jgi:hypothetical protein
MAPGAAGAGKRGMHGSDRRLVARPVPGVRSRPAPAGKQTPADSLGLPKATVMAEEPAAADATGPSRGEGW